MEETAEAVVTGEDILAMRQLASEVPVCDEVLYYAVNMVSNTHPESADCAPSAKKYDEKKARQGVKEHGYHRREGGKHRCHSSTSLSIIR